MSGDVDTAIPSAFSIGRFCTTGDVLFPFYLPPQSEGVTRTPTRRYHFVEGSDPDDHISQYKQRMLAVALPKESREATMCKGFGSMEDILFRARAQVKWEEDMACSNPHEPINFCLRLAPACLPSFFSNWHMIITSCLLALFLRLSCEKHMKGLEFLQVKEMTAACTESAEAAGQLSPLSLALS
ncbi:hypothetical protein F2Q69_00006878 [Brassica cretica]|uniref:Uncharacterized protein n=1 Tax=Brassica cretica TaxID=69181 RepID=A0A8S9NWQ7_BRACR|nr:hypothetical protein F2Q69_00006878 [Brassica cretica]